MTLERREEKEKEREGERLTERKREKKRKKKFATKWSLMAMMGGCFLSRERKPFLFSSPPSLSLSLFTSSLSYSFRACVSFSPCQEKGREEK